MFKVYDKSHYQQSSLFYAQCFGKYKKGMNWVWIDLDKCAIPWLSLVLLTRKGYLLEALELLATPMAFPSFSSLLSFSGFVKRFEMRFMWASSHQKLNRGSSHSLCHI